jgi:hypothetical protein
MHATVCNQTLTVQARLHTESSALVRCVGGPAAGCGVRRQPGGGGGRGVRRHVAAPSDLPPLNMAYAEYENNERHVNGVA